MAPGPRSPSVRTVERACRREGASRT
jgi:hypothetical protein